MTRGTLGQVTHAVAEAEVDCSLAVTSAEAAADSRISPRGCS
jgi:hypothetical protein